MAPLDRAQPLVLVADDDRALRKMLNLALVQEGYQVVQVGSGEQVLQDFQRLQPDLLLLDAMMPELDGFNCCHLLRTQFNTDIPILMVTVLDDQDSIDRAFAVGATDYITKPIHWAVLRQRVKRLLNSDQAVRQAQHIQGQLNAIRASETLQQQVLQKIRQHAQQLQVQLETAQLWESLQHQLLQRIQQQQSAIDLLTDTLDLLRRIFQASQGWLFLTTPISSLYPLDPADPSGAVEGYEALSLLKGLSAQHGVIQYSENSEMEAATEVRNSAALVAQALQVPTLLMAPILLQAPCQGWLLMARSHPEPWTEMDGNRLQTLARLVAIALSQAPASST